MKFLTGSDYPDLCSKCRMAIDQAVDIVVMGADTDDEEAPCNFVYDHGMFCGGHECKAEYEELTDMLDDKEGYLAQAEKDLKNKPEPNKQYALTGGPGDKCIANGNTWAESEVEYNG